MSLQEPKSHFTKLENPTGEAPALLTRVRQVWAVGGGKGGVGKSLVSSCLAISLARMGHHVLAADLDLGGANLHTALGLEQPVRTLGDFISRRATLVECETASQLPNLRVISGAQDATTASHLAPEDKKALLEQLRGSDADYVVFDLGAGTSENTIDFFINADIGILTVLPEPTSIENAYRFIRTAYYRRLHLLPRLAPIRELVEAAQDSKNDLGIRTPADLFRAVSKSNPEIAVYLKDEIQRFRIKLLVNQTRTQSDVDIGFSIKSICKKYFGIDVDYLGYLEYDSAVWQAVRRKRPLMLEFPNSQIASNMEKVTQQLLRRHAHERGGVI